MDADNFWQHWTFRLSSHGFTDGLERHRIFDTPSRTSHQVSTLLFLLRGKERVGMLEWHSLDMAGYCVG